jgi:hypothetical protein
LFPVILADLAEGSAVVPEKFRERQWTRLNDDVSVNAFAERIAKVQAGWASSGKSASSSPSSNEFGVQSDTPSAVVPAQAGTQFRPQSGGLQNLDPGLPQLGLRDDGAKNRAIVDQTQPNRRRLFTYISAGFVAAGGLGAVAIWQPWKASSSTGKSGAATLDPNLKRAIGILEATDSVISDMALAEDLVKGVLDQRPTEADATVVMARIHSYMLLRGWDRSDERFANAKRLSERAMLLAPDNPDAVGALVTYMYMRRVELPRAALRAGGRASRLGACARRHRADRERQRCAGGPSGD